MRLPLKKSPTIICENALRSDWKKILPPQRCSYILGNPPFVGAKEKTPQQGEDVDLIWGDVKGHRVLDYVCGWYHKASEYIQGTPTRCAFVSTNSITQGEQVGVLWSVLFSRFNIHIIFAHRTFPWESEARGKAHVHVVIIGFAGADVPVNKTIFEYIGKEAPNVRIVRNISPYLVEGGNTVVTTRNVRISRSAPEMSKGSEATDDGFLILNSSSDRDALIARHPDITPFIRRYVGGKEFINGIDRWCLWLGEATSTQLRSWPEVKERLNKVRAFRSSSSKKQTVERSATPGIFGEIRQPNSKYLLVPKVSSEHRRFLPMGFLPPEVIANGSALIIPKASSYHFGILTSTMHMAWMRQVCGRMKSDYQYSVSIVYNNYPWPEQSSAKQRGAVEGAAKTVLDAREEFPEATLADLYDPVAMPPSLVKGHAELDRAVELCYRPQPFQNDRQRVEFLFALYERLTAPLMAPAKKARRKKYPLGEIQAK